MYFLHHTHMLLGKVLLALRFWLKDCRNEVTVGSMTNNFTWIYTPLRHPRDLLSGISIMYTLELDSRSATYECDGVGLFVIQRKI